MCKFRTLTADEIECRVGMAKSTGLTLLLYKDARCDMAILDETVGQLNWQRKHEEHKGNLFCSVGIFNEKSGEWVWKEDAGAESNTEAEKGHASDSFKRACVNWGIGRELYTAPFIWISSDKYQCDEKGRCKDKFSVAEIAYSDDRRITKLVITNKGTPVFTFGTQEKPVRPKKATPVAEPEAEPKAPVGPRIHCERCKKIITATKGKDGATIPVADILKISEKRYGGMHLCCTCMKQAEEIKKMDAE